jgi:hypothetical protein
VRDEFKWEKLKPMYIQAYRETFDQAEIDGLIAFYKTPVGQSYIKKTAVLSQKMKDATQAQLQSLLPRMREALRAGLHEAGIE